MYWVLNSGTKGLITASRWRQMQTEEEKILQSVSFFNQFPNHVDIWASSHKVSEKRDETPALKGKLLTQLYIVPHIHHQCMWCQILLTEECLYTYFFFLQIVSWKMKCGSKFCKKNLVATVPCKRTHRIVKKYQITHSLLYKKEIQFMLGRHKQLEI